MHKPFKSQDITVEEVEELKTLLQIKYNENDSTVQALVIKVRKQRVKYKKSNGDREFLKVGAELLVDLVAKTAAEFFAKILGKGP